ncbi:MAG: alpha/beta fold hydrolase [Myxococcota bacterium]
MSVKNFYATTADGWQIALHHWPAQRRRHRYPVLMLHGFGTNRLNLDLDRRYSIARAAMRRGFDVYILDLRGAGSSKPPEGVVRALYHWGFGEYAALDLPAAVQFVLEHSGQTMLHGLGHSLGGMLLYRFASEAPSTLRSLTTLGAPLISELSLGNTEAGLLKLVSKFPPNRWHVRVPYSQVLGLAGRVTQLSKRLVDGIIFNSGNIDSEVVERMATEAIDDVPVRLILEIAHQMARHDDLGPYGYETRLDRIHVPVLAMAGSVDRIAPPGAVQAVVNKIVCTDLRYRVMGIRYGDRADYGHIDLLVGRYAPEEVFPLLLDFLEETDWEFA